LGSWTRGCLADALVDPGVDPGESVAASVQRGRLALEKVAQGRYTEIWPSTELDGRVCPQGAAETDRQIDELASAAEADGEGTAGVVIARYFLGFHYVQVMDFERALDVIAPSLSVAGNSESLLRSVQARALAGLGRHAEAQAAATTAIATARSDEQRDKLSDELADLLQPGE
jgi:hypothetical protein